MAGNDDLRLRRLQRGEHARPVVGVDVGVVRRKPREDREDTLLGEVADEDDAGVRHAHHLVAFGMRQAVGAEFHRAAAEVDRLRRAVIDLVRHDELGAVKRRGDAGAETAEHAEIGRALGSKLVALGGVVEDLRLCP